MELLLGIIGIVLTIILWAPVTNRVANGMRRLRQNRWSAKLYRNGTLQNKRHIAFDDWKSVFAFSDNGDCTQEYRVRVLNIGQTHVREFYVPVFCDTVPLTYASIEAWAKQSRRSMKVEVSEWDERRGAGRFKCIFDPPLAPGERRRFSYGFRLPRIFQDGDDYYVWDVEVPYFEIGGELRFADSWQINYARWKQGVRALPEPQIVNQRVIRWKVPVPAVPSRLHMDVGWTKRSKDTRPVE